MKLLTKPIEKQLIANFETNKTKPKNCVDFKPVVKFFGGGSATWLFTEYNPEERIYFGLCDLGMGSPELGYVSRDELESLRFKPFGLGVERDLYWQADKTLSEYADEARKQRSIEVDWR